MSSELAWSNSYTPPPPRPPVGSIQVSLPSHLQLDTRVIKPLLWPGLSGTHNVPALIQREDSVLPPLSSPLGPLS